MPDIQPLHPVEQPPESIASQLRNAAQMLRARIQVTELKDDANTMRRAADLIVGALDQLGEPNAAAIAAVGTMLANNTAGV